MEDLTYIDSYFTGELSEQEIAVFEQKIVNDPAFAEEVAFYCSATQAIKEQSVEEKKTRFREIYKELNPGGANIKTLGQRKWWPYVAAAAVITALIIGWQLYTKSSSVESLADNYILSQFKQAGVQMGTTQDSLGTGIRLYNENKLAEALQVFENIARSDAANDKAKKLAGIVSLRINDYDKAITYFTALENLQLYSNPGKFYHALTLIKRNHTGDKEAAKQLLKQVVDQKLAEHETAEKWLQDF